MKITLEVDTDRLDGVQAARNVLTFLLEGSLPAPARADQWTPEQRAAMAAANVPPMILPTIPPPPAFIPPPPMDAAPTTNTAESGATAGVPPAATSTASAFELDSAGLPWDARIHSEAKKRNADNTWRYRRGVTDEVKGAVTSELRSKYPQAATAPPPVSVPAPPAAVVPPPPPASVIPPVPPAPSQPAGVLPGPPSVAVTDFKSLMAKAGALMQSGKLTHPQLAQACVACGVASLPALMGAPEKIPAVNAWLDANVPQ